MFHNFLYNRLEASFISEIVHTVPHRKVQTVVLAFSCSRISKISGAREVLAVFMETDGEYSIGGVERFFDAIAVLKTEKNKCCEKG